MWYLLLDESGDLGFDFVNKQPSKFFTVCLLATSDVGSYYGIRRAIKKNLERKVNKGGRVRRLKSEIKATQTSFEVKKYFYREISKFRFGIYAITLNKRRLFEQLAREKERIYNFIARLVLDQIPFEKAVDRVQLVLDKSKSQREIAEFNAYIFRQLKGRLNPAIPLNIDHITSDREPALQAVDLFAWGIFRSYEWHDSEWLKVFREKVRCDKLYLK